MRLFKGRCFCINFPCRWIDNLVQDLYRFNKVGHFIVIDKIFSKPVSETRQMNPTNIERDINGAINNLLIL